MPATQLQVPASPAPPSQPSRPTRTGGSHGARDGAHFGGRSRRRMLRAAPVAAAAVVAGLVALGLVASHHPGGSGHPAGAPDTSDLHAAAAVRPLAAGAEAAGPAAAVTTTVAPAPATASAPPTTQTAVTPPPVGPDGSSLPVLIVFNGATVTLDGAVPSEVAKQGLAALAQATSKTPNPTVVDRLTVDPRVPDSVGVRVIEMMAARFAPGSATVSPEQAPDYLRVVGLMKAKPSLTVLAIAHADQQGNAAYNLQLSQARAAAVVDFLVAQGISPDRLSARGAGSGDLLTQQTNAAGLALNRRTEFVFYGLMVGS